MKNIWKFTIIMSLVLIGCTKNNDPVSTPPSIDYTSKFVGNFNVHDTGYYNVQTIDGSGGSCYTNRVIDRNHSCLITKGSSNNQYELIISYFFGDTINAQIYAYAGVTNPDAITIGLPPIKLLKSNCTIAPAPISIPSEPNYCYYYIGLSLSNRPIGIISANGDTITFSYNCNESEVNGAYTVMINSHFTSTFVRQ